MSSVPIFLFYVFGREKDRFSFILLKVNAELLIHKPVTYTAEVLSEFLFLFAPNLYVEITNMYHQCREIDHNLQLVHCKFQIL